MANDDTPSTRNPLDDALAVKTRRETNPSDIIGAVRDQVRGAVLEIVDPLREGELVAFPGTVGELAINPTRMAREVLDLKRRNRELTWFVLGLAFVVWLMLQGRR